MARQFYYPFKGLIDPKSHQLNHTFIEEFLNALDLPDGGVSGGGSGASGAPGAEYGGDGDIYIDTDNGKVYFKDSAGWTFIIQFDEEGHTHVEVDVTDLDHYDSADFGTDHSAEAHNAADLADVEILTGTGTPEAAVTAAVGALFLRTDGGASTTLYVKESGVGNTGWVAK